MGVGINSPIFHISHGECESRQELTSLGEEHTVVPTSSTEWGAGTYPPKRSHPSWAML